MFFTVYKTTNTVTNKIYIGTHITNDPNDDYLGSGKWLKNSIKKYGIESFTKEILFCYDNAEEMFIKEAELVNEEFIQRSDTYNIKKGGEGGWDYVNKNGFGGWNINNNSPEHKNRSKNGGLISKNKKLGFFQLTKEQLQEIGSKSFLNHKHRQETIQKMKRSHKGKHEGSKNSQFGTIWITNGLENKKIKKEELDIWVEKSYYKGRINHLLKIK